MKANELTIGDWMYSTFCGKPCKVVGIEQYGSGYANVKVTNVSGTKDINSLTPIPLTPEILEKNGFEKYDMVSDTPPYEVDEDGNMHYSLTKDGKKVLWGWWQPDNTYLLPANCTEWITLKYAHELQHLLKLIGYEKEIIL